MPTAQGFEVQPSTASGAQPFHADDLTIDGLLALVQRVKLVWGVPGSGVDASASNPLPVVDAAGETSLAAILAKLTADPATQTTLAAVLAKLSSDPATQTTLAAVLAKLPTAPALDATLTSGAARIGGTVAVSATALPLPTGAAQDGTDGTGITPPAGAVGVRGWLSGIYNRLGSALSVTPSVAGDGAGTLVDSRKTVTTPGTAVALAASSTCKWVTVTALPTNTQQVNVGGSTVLAASGTQTGTPLSASSSITIPVTDPSKVFVDARVSGEGVSFTVGS